MPTINEDTIDDIVLQIPEMKNNYSKKIINTFKQSPIKEIDDTFRGVIFSDHHRGDGSKTDDFKPANESTYLQALDIYKEFQYYLMLAGDIEELAKYNLFDCIVAHSKVYSAEREFHQKNKFFKMDGNHEGYLTGTSTKELNVYFPGIQINSGIKLKYKNLGFIFICHGHQGGTNDGIFAITGNWLIRHLWLPIQKKFNIDRPTPATNMKMRTETERILYDTSEDIPKTIMVAGHTHNFLSASNLPNILTRKPTYFNTGCGIYANGKITGIEIVDGFIQNVEWIGSKKTIVSKYKLETLFEKC